MAVLRPRGGVETAHCPHCGQPLGEPGTGFLTGAAPSGAPTRAGRNRRVRCARCGGERVLSPVHAMSGFYLGRLHRYRARNASLNEWLREVCRDLGEEPDGPCKERVRSGRRGFEDWVVAGT